MAGENLIIHLGRKSRFCISSGGEGGGRNEGNSLLVQLLGPTKTIHDLTTNTAIGAHKTGS